MIFRTLFFIFVFVPVLIVIVPIQFIITRLGLYWSGLPLFFHKVGCVFLGIRVKTIGEPLHGRPTLLLSNHISWTDIIVIGSVADVTFVAKTGVRNTFFVGFMWNAVLPRASSKSRRSLLCAAVLWPMPSSSSTKRRTPHRCR